MGGEGEYRHLSCPSPAHQFIVQGKPQARFFSCNDIIREKKKGEESMIPKELDDTDRKIINELKKNSRISMTELGKKVFMTGQAAKNRLERLQDLGVVERYTVNVNCPVFGYTVHGLFTLRLEEDRAADFYRFVHTTEFHILHCYETETGTVFIDAHFQSEEKRDTFLQVLSAYGSCHLHRVVKEIHGIHPVDE